MSLEDIGNAFLVTGPRRSGRSTALHFAASRALDNGQKIVLVLPRKSPLMELTDNPGALGVLGVDGEPSHMNKLMKVDPENMVIVVDDFDTLANNHEVNPAIEEHVKTCHDHHGVCSWLAASTRSEACTVVSLLPRRRPARARFLLLAARTTAQTSQPTY